MEWSGVMDRIPDIFIKGGVVYLIVQNLFNIRKNRAEVDHQKGKNKAQNVETAGKVIDVYQEVQEIIDQRIAPIMEECQGLRKQLETTNDELSKTKDELRRTNKELDKTKEALESAQSRLREIEANWVCYRTSCPDREQKRPCIKGEILKDLTDEAKSIIN